MCLWRHREHTLQAQQSHTFVLLWVVGILWVLLHSTGWYLGPHPLLAHPEHYSFRPLLPCPLEFSDYKMWTLKQYSETQWEWVFISTLSYDNGLHSSVFLLSLSTRCFFLTQGLTMWVLLAWTSSCRSDWSRTHSYYLASALRTGITVMGKHAQYVCFHIQSVNVSPHWTLLRMDLLTVEWPG